MTKHKIDPCPLCRAPAREIPGKDFSMRCGSEVLSQGAIQCTACKLTQPFSGGAANKLANIKHWNGEVSE